MGGGFVIGTLQALGTLQAIGNSAGASSFSRPVGGALDAGVPQPRSGAEQGPLRTMDWIFDHDRLVPVGAQGDDGNRHLHQVG